jgi:hypothetical protein
MSSARKDGGQCSEGTKPNIYIALCIQFIIIVHERRTHTHLCTHIRMEMATLAHMLLYMLARVQYAHILKAMQQVLQ